jgi:hypothetical protein
MASSTVLPERALAAVREPDTPSLLAVPPSGENQTEESEAPRVISVICAVFKGSKRLTLSTS